MTFHIYLSKILWSFSFGSTFNISLNLFETTHLIVRSMLEIFDISIWWVSLWLFGHHIFYFRSLSLFPNQILVCAIGFCSSLSFLIWRFTFGDLHLVSSFSKNNKLKSGKIYRHKSMHVSRSTEPFTNHSWQVWRFIYNNHIDVKSSPTII